ncbi:hypothetical protein GCM10007388_46050 [Pseudoduganella plicata]|uniref:Uncharacterized protein n=1 Tax=Pseudoduganella plicata TaxID=321984 RepID=A0AA87Y6X1_9BURK|nr:hypothetical protein GCM10007388_46050 [Pseudoduganella plicata]
MVAPALRRINVGDRHLSRAVARNGCLSPKGAGVAYRRPGIMPFIDRIIFIMPPPESFFIIVCICSN